MEDRLSVFKDFIEKTEFEGEDSLDLRLDYENDLVSFRLGEHDTLKAEWYTVDMYEAKIFFADEYTNQQIATNSVHGLQHRYKNLIDRIRNDKIPKDEIILLETDGKLLPFVNEQFYNTGVDIFPGRTSTFYRTNIGFESDYWKKIPTQRVINKPHLQYSEIQDTYGSGVASLFHKLNTEGHELSDISLVLLDEKGTAAIYVDDVYIDMT